MKDVQHWCDQDMDDSGLSTLLPSHARAIRNVQAVAAREYDAHTEAIEAASHDLQ